MRMAKKTIRSAEDRASIANAYDGKTIKKIIDDTNENLHDSMYIWEHIFLQDKKSIGRCYRTDFSLKTRKEVQKLSNEKNIVLSPRYKHVDLFVYNERTDEIVPFKKNDVLMYDHGEGYLTFDGTNYIYYDDNGIEIGRAIPTDDPELRVAELPEVKWKKKNKPFHLPPEEAKDSKPEMQSQSEE